MGELQMASAHGPAGMADPGVVCAELWRDYLQGVDALTQTVGALRRREREAFPWLETWCSCLGRGAHPERTALTEVAKGIVGLLVAEAARRFTPPGCHPLAIPHEPYRYRYVDQLARAPSEGETAGDWVRAFDPREVWADLAREYGGPSASERGFEQARATLADLFGIAPEQAVERRGDGIVLNLPVMLDSFDLKHRGQKRLAFHSAEALERMVSALENFAAWCGDGDSAGLVNALRRALARFGSPHGAPLRSREKIALGQSAQLVTFSSRFEVVLRGTLADQFQVFMALFRR